MSTGGKLPARLHGRSFVRGEISALPRSMTLPLLRYIHAEQAAGAMLMLGAVLALAWANGPLSDWYDRVWGHRLTLFFLTESARHWVNDGLMVFFFLLVGLEIKRELVHGELSSWRAASLPVAAALGGMVLPAGIYALINLAPGGRPGGWGIPVATDIAFALGVLALLGKRVPTRLKVFLLAFATADDVGGVLIIALVYSTHLSWGWLLAAAGVVAAIVLLRRLRVVSSGPYAALGVALWFCVLESGIHATIAGVVLGLLSPVTPPYDYHRYLARTQRLTRWLARAAGNGDEARAQMVLGQLEELARATERPAERFERQLRPWVSYVVLPVFALANAGVALSAQSLREAAASPVAWGIVAALLVGKFAGVSVATWAAVRTGLSRLPAGVTWGHLFGASVLAGIGFTVSLFIAELSVGMAVHPGASEVLGAAKIAILLASAIAAVAGVVFLLFTRPAPGDPSSELNHGGQTEPQIPQMNTDG